MSARSCDYFDEAAGRFVCDFVERLPTTDTGKPFSLYEWQRSAIMDFYGSMETDEDTGERLRKYWYLYLEIPKKNGKSDTNVSCVILMKLICRKAIIFFIKY